jgi:hypothetical protein
MKKGTIKGIAKASIVILSLFILVFFSVFYIIPVFAVHITAGTVMTSTGARNIDTLQLVTLIFSVNKTSGNNNITNVTINFDGSGWTVPSANSSVTCTSPGAVPFRSIVTGTWITCNTTAPATGNFSLTDKPFNITVANVRAPATAQISTFTINTTDDIGNVNTTTASITVWQLNATATVTPVTSVISAAQNYIFTVSNVGTDELDRINISYATAGFVDTEANNVTCPLISVDTWTAAVDPVSDSITCTKNVNPFPIGASFNVTVSNFIANDTGGIKYFYVDVRGTLGGNYTILLNPPNVTVYGTASTTFGNSVIANQTVGANRVRVAGLNISATGEDINLTAVKVFLSGNGTNLDVFNVSLYEGATLVAGTGGSFSGSPLAVNLSLASPLNIIAGTSRLVNITFNLSTTANAGDVVGINITGNSSLTLIGNSSGLAIITGGTPQGQSTNITIYGNITIVARNGVVANATPGQANFIAANVTVKAGGESIQNINLNMTVNADNSADLSQLLIYSDGVCDGSVSGDTLVTSMSSGFATNKSVLIALTGQTVARDATNCYSIAFNISSGATGGDKFNVSSIVATSVNATGMGSSIVLTSTGTGLGSSQNVTIFGNLTIAGTSWVAPTTLIGTNNITVISYNFSATGEIISLHEINITAIGSIVTLNLSNVALYNGTSDNGIFNNDGTETFIANISVNTSGTTYNFKLGSPLQIPSGGTNVLLVVFNLTTSAGSDNLSGGTTFGANLTPIVVRGNSSTILLTPVITTQFSGTSMIYGNLSVSGADLTPDYANTGQTNVRIINLTFTSTGEAMNITLLNIAFNNTNNNDVTTAKLYNGSSIGSLIATATRSGNIAAFGTIGTVLYMVPAGSSASLVVTFDINSSATGGDKVGAFLNRTSDIVIYGAASNVSITIVGTPAKPTGVTTIGTLSATATVTPTSAAIGNQTNYTFAITNGGGAYADTLDQIVINYTSAGYNDTEVGNITCPVAVSAWTAAVNTTLHTITCTAGTNITAGASAQINVTNFKASTLAGVKQFDVSVRGANGQGTFAITTSKPQVTVGGTITINGTNKNPTTTIIGTSNVTAIAYNFTASGEAMNITQINVTRNGTATSSDISSVILARDMNADTVYDSTVDTVVQIKTVNATPDIYSFSLLNLQVVNNMTLLIVFNISASATGSRTFGVNISSSSVIITGDSSGGIITPTVTNSNSSLSRIVGNLTMTVTDLAPANVSQGQKNITYLRLDFTATGEAFNVTEINVTKTGTLDVANTTVQIFDDTGATANSWDATDASLGSNNTAGNMTAVSAQVVPGTPKILYIVYNLTASQSGDKTVGAQVIGSNITAITNTTLVSVTPTGAVANSTVSNVQAQANLVVGTLATSGAWITNQAEGNTSLTITIPLTNSGNTTATYVNLSRTITLLNYTNQSINGNFTITQTDVVTSVVGNGTQANLTYTITVGPSATWDGNVNVNISIAYNDTNTRINSTNSPATSYTLAVFQVDNTDPVITRNPNDSPGNNSAVNGTISVNVTITDATSGLNSAKMYMIVANGTTTLIFNMSNTLSMWNSTFISTDFAEGPYNISFNVTDVAGNNVRAINVVRITVDNTVPTFSGEVVNDTTINPLQLTDFSINVTERTFDASTVVVSVLNFTNATIKSMTATCTHQTGFVHRCNMTWDGTNDTAVNVSTGTYRFRINVTDNATQFNTTNSTNIVTVSTDTTAPTVESSSPASAVANPVTTSTPSLNVTTNEAATCKFNISTDSHTTYASMPYTMTGADTAHNFTLSLLDGTHIIYVRCTDAVGNGMSSGERIEFTIDTRNIRNITIPNTLGDYFLTNNWNGFELPLFRLQNTSVANTNVTTVLASVLGNFSNFYGYDGSSWKSFQPGAPVNSLTNFTDNAGVPYYIFINTTSKERLEIP